MYETNNRPFELLIIQDVFVYWLDKDFYDNQISGKSQGVSVGYVCSMCGQRVYGQATGRMSEMR